jgi:hypothetical protein
LCLPHWEPIKKFLGIKVVLSAYAGTTPACRNALRRAACYIVES